jgi:apolipoprotein N-acyltransferase
LRSRPSGRLSWAPMVRSTNTGITAWIDPSGDIRQATAKFAPVVVPMEIPIHPLPPALVEKTGDGFGLFSVIAALAGWLRMRRLSKK